MDTNVYQNPGQIGDTFNYFQQTFPDSCAIMSQKFIMDEFGVVNQETGMPFTEDELVAYATEHGYYTPGEGTTFDQIGHVMSDLGIPCHLTQGNNVYSLVEQLAQGHKVIVGVDADELWEGNVLTRIGGWFNDLFGGIPNHAIVVVGIDATDPNNVMVIVDDPGSGEHHKAYPLDQFMDAWQDSECFMCSTDIPTTGLGDFSQIGHLDNICGVDYNDFCMFTDLSNSFQSYTPDSVYDSLYPAFEQLADGNDLSQVVQEHHFGEHIDPIALQQHFFDTNMQLLHGMAESPLYSIHNAMHGDIGEQMLAHDMAQNYSQLADAYTQNGDMAQAEFFNNQADFMNMCQALGFDTVYSVMYPDFV